MEKENSHIEKKELLHIMFKSRRFLCKIYLLLYKPKGIIAISSDIPSFDFKEMSWKWFSIFLTSFSKT